MDCTILPAAGHASGPNPCRWRKLYNWNLTASNTTKSCSLVRKLEVLSGLIILEVLFLANALWNICYRTAIQTDRNPLHIGRDFHRLWYHYVSKPALSRSILKKETVSPALVFGLMYSIKLASAVVMPRDWSTNPYAYSPCILSICRINGQTSLSYLPWRFGFSVFRRPYCNVTTISVHQPQMAWNRVLNEFGSIQD